MCQLNCQPHRSKANQHLVITHGPIVASLSHMRSALAPVYDFRKPIEKVRDRIIDRLARAALIDLNDAARSPRS